MDKLPWSSWSNMPEPEACRKIIGPKDAGIYQIRIRKTKENVQFGIGINCQKRMRSLFPKPFGSGTRNNQSKREYILENWQELEYRTLSTANKTVAVLIENFLKKKKNHLFNT